MKAFKIILLASIVILFTSCASNRIKGLWEVERILTGSSEINPQSRWVRFDKKNKQVSGNGWYKHSYGTWDFKKRMLILENENGFKDEFEPFKVEFFKKGMLWSRKEDAHMVKVKWKKIKEIPRSNMDNLLGVWRFKTALVKGKDVTREYDPQGNRYLKIKWDKMFEHHNTPNGTISGFYRADVNIDEIEFLYNNREKERIVWRYELKKNKLVMSSSNAKEDIILEFHRIHEIPK